MDILEALNKSFKKGDYCGETVKGYSVKGQSSFSFTLYCYLTHPKYPDAGSTTASANFNWKEGTMTVQQNASYLSVKCDIPEDLMEYKPEELKIKELIEEQKAYLEATEIDAGNYVEVKIGFHDESLNFSIETDLPFDMLNACVINWQSRNEDNLNAESLVDYINSKSGMTGYTAMTINK